MKVLLFVADGDPGGGTTHVLQLLRGLGNLDLAILTERGSYLLKEARDLGIRSYEGEFFHSRLDPRTRRYLNASIEEFEPDLIHCHGGRAAFFRTWSRCQIPSVYTVHGLHYPRKNFVARRLGRLSEMRSMARMQEVVFVSKFDQQLAIHDGLIGGETSYCVIYNGICPPRQGSVQPTGEIGFIGRLVPQKHPELFLEVVEQLPGRGAVIAGGGILEESMRAEIVRRGLADRVRMLGMVSHQQSLEILAGLDALVMTSRWEGLPLLPLEAMSLGIPVVATAVGGLPEVVVHGQSGLLAGEVAAELAAAIRQLAQDPDLRASLVAGGAARVREHFAEEAMLQALTRVYAEAVRAAAPSRRQEVA